MPTYDIAKTHQTRRFKETDQRGPYYLVQAETALGVEVGLRLTPEDYLAIAKAGIEDHIDGILAACQRDVQQFSQAVAELRNQSGREFQALERSLRKRLDAVVGRIQNHTLDSATATVNVETPPIVAQ